MVLDQIRAGLQIHKAKGAAVTAAPQAQDTFEVHNHRAGAEAPSPNA
jgi:hypothetical protein